MQVIDRLNTEHGRDTVTLGASGRKQPWGLRAERRSPRYTSHWEELLRAV
jgi:DNA polymerase V